MAEILRWCHRCDVLIPPARLQALPETHLCGQCSAEVGSDFQLTAVPESLGKAGSLKKNYGSRRLIKTRRRIHPKE